MKYVIIGEQGEYSDRVVWVVGVYDSEEEAMRLVVEKSAEARASGRYEYPSYSLVEVLENTWGRYGLDPYTSPEEVEAIRLGMDKAAKQREAARTERIEQTKQHIDRLAGKKHDWDDPEMQKFLIDYMNDPTARLYAMGE